MTETAGRSERRGEGLASSIPLHPFLFAAYPVLFLYSNNLTDVSLGDVVGPLLVVLGSTALGFAALALIWRAPQRAAIIVSAVVVPLLLFTRLHRLVPDGLGVTRLMLLGICLAGLALAVVVALRARERLATLTLALNVVAGVLVGMTLVPIVQDVLASGGGGGEPGIAADPAMVAGPGSPSDRSIWYLVFDRYGSEASIGLEYGIEQNDLVPWLRERGFQVVDGSHANYVRTELSLASVLNMTHLDELAARMGPDSGDYQPINRMLRESSVAELLKARGYEYVHIGSWFEPTRGARLADRKLSPESVVSFATTVYDLSALPFLARTLGIRAEESFANKHRDAALYEFDRLEELVGAPGPTYVFAHLLMPHPPYVFLADGTFAPDEATYGSQLAYTNQRIRELVEPLVALPEDERPIIVLGADEGPYPARYVRQKDAFDWSTATPEELETKFGILEALYLPGPEGTQPLPASMTSVNTFRSLFRRYFGADLPDLPDRSFASTKAHPYDLLDITDRLPRAEPAGP